MDRLIVKAGLLAIAAFGLLAVVGLFQTLTQADGANSWFVFALCLVAVSCGALVLALWRLQKD